MEVKNYKKYFKPYTKFSNNCVTIMWDYKPILKINTKGIEIETPLAVWQEYTFNYIPTFNEIKNIIISYYNNIIDKQILSGFTWNGMQIWLSNENQFNYKVIYDMAVQTKGQNLPIKVKFGDNNNIIYYEFKTLEEISDFYIKLITHIQNTLQEGWIKKDNVNWNFYN